jgi:hypothetical protein
MRNAVSSDGEYVACSMALRGIRSSWLGDARLGTAEHGMSMLQLRAMVLRNASDRS